MAGSMGDVSDLFAGMGNFSAAFGLDKLQFGTILGFYGTECGNILGLGGALYAAVTAMGLLAGEEGGHTAEFLLTHPVSRLRVCMEKLAALAAMILGLNLICLTCGAGGIAIIKESVEWGKLLRYHGTLLLMHLEIGALCFGLSAFLRRGGLGLGGPALLRGHPDQFGQRAGLAEVFHPLLLRRRRPGLCQRGHRRADGGGVHPGGAGCRSRPVVVWEKRYCVKFTHHLVQEPPGSGEEIS